MAYRLKSKRPVRQYPILKLSVGSRNRVQENIFLINAEAAEYTLIPKLGSGSIEMESNDLAIERLSFWQSFRARINAAATFKRKKFLKFDAFKLLFGGPYATRRMLIRTNRLLTRLQSRPDGEAVRRFPELLIGWDSDTAPRTTGAVKPQRAPVRIAVVVHLYYPETWPEMANVLRRIPFEYDLIFTTVPERAELAAVIQQQFPAALVRIVENRGRDVRPFLLLLEEGKLAPYELICKIHGKRSIANDPSGNMGDIFRRRSIFDMLLGPNCMKRVIDRFLADPELGILGSHHFHLNRDRDHNIFWRENNQDMNNLIVELGADPAQVKPDFFEGTMFWSRPRALESLRKLKTTERFALECGASDGALEHAVERIFAVAAKVAGFRVDDIDGLGAP